MLGYYCTRCQMYFRGTELVKDRRCPECGDECKPRLVLGGQVMGGLLV